MGADRRVTLARYAAVAETVPAVAATVSWPEANPFQRTFHLKYPGKIEAESVGQM